MNSNFAELSTFKVIIPIFCNKRALSIVVCLYSCLEKIAKYELKTPKINEKRVPKR